MKHSATLFADDAGRYAYVKAGFSWPALFLGSFWAVAKRRDPCLRQPKVELESACPHGCGVSGKQRLAAGAECTDARRWQEAAQVLEGVSR